MTYTLYVHTLYILYTHNLYTRTYTYIHYAVELVYAPDAPPRGPGAGRGPHIQHIRPEIRYVIVLCCI